MKKHLFGAVGALFVGMTIASVLPSTAQALEVTCEIQEIIEHTVNPRIHVMCRNTLSVTGVHYIAVPSSSPLAARFLSQAQAAMLSGKNFFADIPTSGASNSAGCLASDCRNPTWFGVWH